MSNTQLITILITLTLFIVFTIKLVQIDNEQTLRMAKEGYTYHRYGYVKIK